MLAALRRLFISKIVGAEVPPEKVQSESVHKIQDFTEWFIGDIYGFLAESTELNIKFIEQDDDRCVPEHFFFEIMLFSKPFIYELIPDLLLRPVLLFCDETFFSRFTNFVCLKLIKDDDSDIDFLKVMAFLMVVINMSFDIRCYRPLDDIPGVLYMLLNDDLKTKFYEEDRFDDILLLCDKLKKDEKWYESTIEEIRGYVKDSLDTEVAIEMYDNPFQPDLSKTRILDVKSKHWKLDSKVCPYCQTDCILLLKGIWKPKMHSTLPECLQM